jgi:outer membrane protein
LKVVESMRRTNARVLFSSVCLLWMGAQNVRAQTPSNAPLTLMQAVQGAIKNYPALRVSQEQVNAASAAIQLARTAYLPRVDAIAQVNRATRNNVFGMLLPQSVIPSISGPVIGSNNLGSVWGSAAGGLVSWEPFDFGLREANMAAANAARAQSEAALKRTEFDVAVNAADAYLTLAAAREASRASQAGVERAETVLKIITAQVNAELRPGADRSRAEAELAAARTQLIQSRKAESIARATLAQFSGGDPERMEISPGRLLEAPPEAPPQRPNPNLNPLMIEQNSAVEQARAQLRALERSYFPRFQLQAAAYARGTGAEVNGNRLGGVNGLAPSVQNYAVGFTATFPVFDLPGLRARESAQSATVRLQAARAEQIAVDLRAQWDRAVADLEGARQVAANTPVQLAAARAATQQATARYQSGLGGVTEVAEAQRLLTQAEIDDSLARLGVWRGLLAIAAVAGNIEPFVDEASR